MLLINILFFNIFITFSQSQYSPCLNTNNFKEIGSI